MRATHHVHAMFILSLTLTKTWLPHDARARCCLSTGFHTGVVSDPRGLIQKALRTTRCLNSSVHRPPQIRMTMHRHLANKLAATMHHHIANKLAATMCPPHPPPCMHAGTISICHAFLCSSWSMSSKTSNPSGRKASSCMDERVTPSPRAASSG